MADQLGALALPTPEPQAGHICGDPAIDAIGDYLQAVLNADLLNAWTTVAGGQQVVQTLTKASPEDGAFQKEDMPVLFVWRGDSKTEQLTDDWLERTSQVNLLWVTRPTKQSDRAARSPVYNAVAAEISRALWIGRDPAWFDLGDTDPRAQQEGSVLMQRAGLFRWPSIDSCKPQHITIQIDETPPRPYWAVAGVIQISEILDLDPAAHGAPTAAIHTINQTDPDSDTVGFTFDQQL